MADGQSNADGSQASWLGLMHINHSEVVCLLSGGRAHCEAIAGPRLQCTSTHKQHHTLVAG